MQLRNFTITTFLLLAILTSCSNLKKVNQNNEIMLGTIEEKTFTNKGGKEINTIQDLYFKVQNGETYFIKFMSSSISYDQAKAQLGKKISVEAEIIDGLWDVPDDNPQFAQSRTGLYIVIKSFTPIIKKKD